MPDFAVGGLLSAIERMLEQYFDASSSTLNAMSNAISPLVGSQDPNDQLALQALETSAQSASDVLTKAATNGRDRVDKKIASAESKVRPSWFTRHKDYELFKTAGVFPVKSYFVDYWNALDDLAQAAEDLHFGDIKNYDKEALGALHLENTGNTFYSMGVDSLLALR
jgi:hypothetical protein